MAGRSGVISHTTLHEAAQGNRLPSWDTTVEFVKACGADPEDYRETWNRADHVVSGRSTVPGTVQSVPGEVASKSEPGAPSQRAMPRVRQLVVGAVSLAVLGAGLGAWTILSPDEPRQPVDTGAPSAGECPISQTNPPPAPPEHEGDRAMFVADVTMPDCTQVKPRASVVKTWRFKNAGTTRWDSYSLRRIDRQGPDTCTTAEEVPIRDTAPGEFVDVSTRVSMPDSAGFCFVRFKMKDAPGADAFPGGRPVNLQIIVR